MYDNAHSKVRITNSYSNPINVSVGVHQGSVLSPLLFIIVTEALSREFRTGFPWELLYADELAIVAESIGELKVRLKNWKDGVKEKGLNVNVGKNKVLRSRHDVSKLKIASVKFPCGVCMKDVGANSILSCQNWVHKRCSGIKTCLRNCEDFICKTCSATTRAVDPFPTCIAINRDKFEIVSEFCYLNALGQTGDYTEDVTARIGTAWKTFHELLL